MACGGSHKDWGREPGGLRYPLTDAHAHIGSGAEGRERILKRIPTMASAGCPREAERLDEILGREENAGFLIPTYGLHPWHAGRDVLEKMEPFLERAALIGEIGMDSVWCDVPLGLQREVFEYQLSLAGEKGRPVILHTKGQEKTIADIIGNYPNRYLVHWYSAQSWQEAYLEMGCYFSIGPDVWWNPAVRKLARRVPADRILIETDGMGAVRWAYEEAAANKLRSGSRQTPLTVEEALENTLEEAAVVRGVGALTLARQIRDNFMEFCR